jgi:hypothetical protein
LLSLFIQHACAATNVLQHKKRLMRKDYQGDGKRDNKWNEKKTHRADQYLEAGDMHNEAFEEYYKVQVGAGFKLQGAPIIVSACNRGNTMHSSSWCLFESRHVVAAQAYATGALVGCSQ